ncbi:MAG: DUF3301 domain-containing protein [Pseudomonadota bacterium]
MQEFWLLPALLAVVWFWLDSMRAREAALRVVRRACARHEVQLLDETVALVRLRLGRDPSGRVGWRRRFRFEFSNEGDNRSSGEVELLGRQVTALHMEMGPFVLHEMDTEEPVRH